MDVQSNVRDVVNVLAGGEPDNFADLAFGKVAGQTGKVVRADLFFFREFGYVVQSGALAVSSSVVRWRRGLVHPDVPGDGAGDFVGESLAG